MTHFSVTIALKVMFVRKRIPGKAFICNDLCTNVLAFLCNFEGSFQICNISLPRNTLASKHKLLFNERKIKLFMRILVVSYFSVLHVVCSTRHLIHVLVKIALKEMHGIVIVVSESILVEKRFQC